ncbi:MAG: GTP-binding protein, partial [Hyphomicrobiales bacterium]|nr:GTP-binding protein [Hyphomicrobiales bacterium]
WLAAAARLPATDGHGHDHDHHGHDADAAQDGRDPSRHSARIRGYVLRRAAPIGAGRLDLFLSLLRAALGPKLLRVKGLVKLDDDPGRPLLVQAVQKSFHPPVRLDGWPDSDRDTRIVFIVDGVSPETIDRFYAAFAGETAADAPDAAALADNPLAPRAGGLLE